MGKKIFVDTSAWLASVTRNDRNYKLVSEKFKAERKDHSLIFTSNDIIDETVMRLVYDVGWGAAKKFIDYIKKSIEERILVQLWTDEQIQDEAFSVLEKFKEHKLSLTDATSMVLVKRFKIDCVLTLDSHFVKAGVRVC